MSNVNLILTQVLGLTATFTLCLSYFVKSKKMFLLCNLAGDIMYGLTFILSNSWSAGMIVLVSCVQYICFIAYGKKNKKAPKWLGFAFVASFVAISILTFESWWDLIPLLTYTWYTFVLYKDDVSSIRVLYILPAVAIILYDVMVKAYANAFEDGMDLSFLLSAIVVDLFKSKKLTLKHATLPKKFMCAIIGVKFFNLQSSVNEISTAKIHDNKNYGLSGAYKLCPIDRYG